MNAVEIEEAVSVLADQPFDRDGFPKAYLERSGVTERRTINQMANYALLEWPDNLEISDEEPASYVPKVDERFNQEDWMKMQELHALPANWHMMPYADFLEARRKSMAGIIRRGCRNTPRRLVHRQPVLN